MSKLFICGSLCKGMVHHGIIRESIISCSPAIVKGSIYRLNVGFPVYLNDGDTKVMGYVVELKDSDILNAILDEFHAINHRQPSRSLYERVTVDALIGSQMLEVEVFALRPKKLPKSSVSITNGDWESDFFAQQPLSDRFSEEEIEYIKKIGSTTGREVIPYTPMTRQLEKQGLVIDKGRRPALTPSGKEVFKYLGF